MRLKENIQVFFDILWRQHEQKKQNWQQIFSYFFLWTSIKVGRWVILSISWSSFFGSTSVEKTCETHHWRETKNKQDNEEPRNNIEHTNNNP